MNLKVQNTYRQMGRSCPIIEYYEADHIENKRDLMAIDTAIEAAMACCECARRRHALTWKMLHDARCRLVIRIFARR